MVIPESIRKQLDLREGAQFLVLGENDVVTVYRTSKIEKYWR